MSQENVALIRQLIRALNEHDVQGFKDLFVLDAEIIPLRAAVEATVFRETDAVDRFFAASDETWSSVRGEIEEIRDAGDQVLVHGQMHGRGRGSGAEVEVPLSLVATFQGGRVASLRSYTDRAEALQAAGLSE